MTTYPGWTPASRPGIIPLHPLTFGTILGRSFAALRHNPRVLLGFALGIQSIAYFVVIAGTGAVGWATLSRLDTVRVNSDEFDAILAGSIALIALTAGVLSILTSALNVIVQGVVVSEVAHAAVAEKLTVRVLWQRVKPVIWRLIGYTLLLAVAIIVLIALVMVAMVTLSLVAVPFAIGIGVIAALAAIPLTLWIATKLLLVPSVIVLEHATMTRAIARSWRLTRGRFWPALGIIMVVSIIFSVMAQVVASPFSVLGSVLVPIIAPTDDPDLSMVAGLLITVLLAQAVGFLVQAVSSVVQSTSAALIYIDCRMRREGLDLALLAYVERRDAGDTALRDPYLENIGHDIAPRPQAWATPPAPYGVPSQPSYGGYPPPAHGVYPLPPDQYAGPPTPYYGPPATAPQASATPPAAPPTTPAAPQAPTQWTAPGTASDKIDPDSPWS